MRRNIMDPAEVKAAIVRMGKEAPRHCQSSQYWRAADWYLYTNRGQGPFDIVDIVIAHARSEYHIGRGGRPTGAVQDQPLAGPETLETLLLYLPLIPLHTGCLLGAYCMVRSSHALHPLERILLGLELHRAHCVEADGAQHWTLYRLPPCKTFSERFQKAPLPVCQVVVPRGG